LGRVAGLEKQLTPAPPAPGDQSGGGRVWRAVEARRWARGSGRRRGFALSLVHGAVA